MVNQKMHQIIHVQLKNEFEDMEQYLFDDQEEGDYPLVNR
jgi:hypothetical protein